MPENKLIFKDGSYIENGRAGYTQGSLWCYAPGYSMAEIAAIFLEPQKTEEIIFRYGGKQDVYEGYTNCVSMIIDADGMAHVCMQKAATENSAE